MKEMEDSLNSRVVAVEQSLTARLTTVEGKVGEVLDTIRKRVVRPTSYQLSPFRRLTAERKRTRATKAAESRRQGSPTPTKKVDIFRPVSAEKKKEFYEWLNRKPKESRGVITGWWGWKMFDEMRQMGPWFVGEHITELLALMRKRQKNHPTLYDDKAVIVDLDFCMSLTQRWIEMATKKDFATLLRDYKFDADFLSYALGAQPMPYGKSWQGANRVFFVCNFDDKHFVLLVMLLDEAKINVYDCNPALYSDEALGHLMEPMVTLFPKYLKQTGKFSHLGKRLDTKWEWQRIPDLPVNRKSESCGAYSVKFIDFLITNTSMDNLHDNTMDDFREKFAVEVFHGEMDP